MALTQLVQPSHRLGELLSKRRNLNGDRRRASSTRRCSHDGRTTRLEIWGTLRTNFCDCEITKLPFTAQMTPNQLPHLSMRLTERNTVANEMLR
jgi:hypothetical protein